MKEKETVVNEKEQDRDREEERERVAARSLGRRSKDRHCSSQLALVVSIKIWYGMDRHAVSRTQSKYLNRQIQFICNERY